MLNIPQWALDLAVKGGWKPENIGYRPNKGVTLTGIKSLGLLVEVYVERKGDSWRSNGYMGTQNGGFWIHITQIGLQQEFWKALSKSLNWKEEVCEMCGTEYDSDDEHTEGEGCSSCLADFIDGPASTIPEWKYNARMFGDIMLEGRETTEYWKNLDKTDSKLS